MKKRKPKKKNYMDAVFVRSTEREWKEQSNGIIVIDIIHKGFYHRIAQKFFYRPPVSHIALDEMGTTIWRALDGKKTLYGIVQLMQRQYPEEPQMLNRVIYFTKTLQKNHFIQLKCIDSKENDTGNEQPDG